MKYARTFGNRERDEEIMALYRRLDALENKGLSGSLAPVVLADQLTPVGAINVATADETTTPVFSASLVEFDQAVGFTVTADGGRAVISGTFGGGVTIGAAVTGGTSPAVLFVNAGNIVGQDPGNFDYDNTNNSLTVKCVNSSVKKAIIGTETTTATVASSYSTIMCERISTGVVGAGFGNGINFVVGQSSGASVQWGAITSEYSGVAAFPSADMVFRTALNADNTPVMTLAARGDLSFAVKSGGGGFGLRLANLTAASVTSPLSGALIYDSGVKYYDGAAWQNIGGATTPSVALDMMFNNFSWSVPAALTEWNARKESRVQADWTNATQARILISTNAAPATSTADIRAQYSTNSGSTWSYLDGGTGPSVNVGGSGVAVSSWVSLAAGAKADVQVRIVGINGDATGVAFGTIQLQVK